MPRALTLACGRVFLPAHADRSGGGDRHRAGASVRLGVPAGTDLFMAGNRVVVAVPMGGSAHMAGRRITVGVEVAGDLFAAGYHVTEGGRGRRRCVVTGYDLVLGEVTGKLRAAGSETTGGAVGGYARITGADVALQGVIAAMWC